MKSTTIAFALMATFTGCSGMTTSMVPAVKASPTEFRATLVGYDEERPVEISTVKGRFRLVDGDRIFVGDLDPEGEVVVLGPKTKTFFRYRQGKFSELFETHDRPAATRYAGATNASGVQLMSQLLAPMRSPCEAASQDRTHQVCEHSEAGENLQSWSHTYHSRSSAQEGFKKYEVTVSHLYNTQLGMIVSASQGLYFRDPVIGEISGQDFEVPHDYTQILSDEELRDPRFGYIGSPSVFSGSGWEGFLELVTDQPPPPERPNRTYQKEKWWSKGDSPDIVYLERLYCHEKVDFDKLPLELHFAFPIKAWDEPTEFGEHSFRDGPTKLTFVAENQIFKINVLEESRAELIPKIAKSLIARAKKDKNI